jgi:hypothetical protein
VPLPADSAVAVAHFQKGFLSPAGASALFVVASVPESSEIFSSSNRDDGALSSSSRGIVGVREGYSDFMAYLHRIYDLSSLKHLAVSRGMQNLDTAYRKIGTPWNLGFAVTSIVLRETARISSRDSWRLKILVGKERTP